MNSVINKNRGIVMVTSILLISSSLSNVTMTLMLAKFVFSDYVDYYYSTKLFSWYNKS